MHRAALALAIAIFAFGPVQATCTDLDGDGYYQEEGCGGPVDCNDASATTHPGAVEACDGYDNDCDLSVDESTSCITSCDNPEVLPREDSVSNSPDDDFSYPRLAWNSGVGYGIAWMGSDGGFRTLDVNGNNATGVQVSPRSSFYGASLVWTGNRYGAAAGNGFQLFDQLGQPIGSPVTFPTTIAEPSLAWNGSSFGLLGVGCSGACFYGLSADGVIGYEVPVFAGTWWDVELVWNPVFREYGALLRASGQLYFARLTTAGIPISAPSAVALGTNLSIGNSPQLLWNGSGYAFIWTDPDNAVRFRRLSSDGAALGNDRVLIPDEQYDARFVWTGSEYGLVWSSSALRFASVDQDGNMELPVVVESNGRYADIVWNGTEFLIAYGSQGGFGPIKTKVIACNCVDADNDQYTNCTDCNDSNPNINEGATEVCNGTDDDCDGQVDEGNPGEGAACSTGQQGVCAAGTQTCVNGSLTCVPNQAPSSEECTGGLDEDCDGQVDVADPDCPATCTDLDGDGYYQEVGCGSGADCNDADPGTHPSAVEVCDARDNNCDLLVDNSDVCDLSCDTPEIPPVLTIGSYEAKHPSMVWDGHRYVVAHDYDSSGVGIALIDGVTMESSDTYLGFAAQANSCALAWTGSAYGLAWHEPTVGLKFVVLDQDIQPASSVLSVAPGGFSLAVAWGGSAYGVAWSEAETAYPNVYFALIDQSGGTVTSLTPLTSVSNDPEYVDVVWTGSYFAVVWVDDLDGNDELYLSIVTRQGMPTGPPTRLTTSPGRSLSPSLTWTGTELGVSYFEQADGRHYLVRTDLSGELMSPPIALTPAGSSISRLFWTGAEFGLVWSGPGINATHFARYASDGQPISAPVTLPSPCWHLEDAIWTGSTLGIIDRPGGNDVYFARVGCNGSDEDGDGWATSTDCNDSDPSIHPGATEDCNGVDDDCDGQADEDASGVDSDGDTIPNACDNCRSAPNPDQLEYDGDGVGNACDNCVFVSNPAQSDNDFDQRGDVCDNCPQSYNPSQDDVDVDHRGDACDNCLLDYNPSQSDFNSDNQGDLCDLNDGLIYLFSTGDPGYIEWQGEQGFTSWNVYEGDLGVLRSGGPYTQLPGSNPRAERHCGVSDAWVEDFGDPAPGTAAFHLVTGRSGGVESSLGTNSAGVLRPNSSPCP